MLVSAFLAGAYIAFGGLVAITVSSGLDPQTWGTLPTLFTGTAFTLGLVNKILEPYAGVVLAKVLLLVGIMLFIQRRPRGLFPQKGRAAEA